MTTDRPYRCNGFRFATLAEARAHAQQAIERGTAPLSTSQYPWGIYRDHPDGAFWIPVYPKEA